MELERVISFEREKERADIVVFNKTHPTSEEIIVELKKPKLKDGKEQLKSYCNATGAIIGVWTNGNQISYYHKKDPNFFEDIPDIPKENQKLKDILTERWTIDDLVAKDKLVRVMLSPFTSITKSALLDTGVSLTLIKLILWMFLILSFLYIVSACGLLQCVRILCLVRSQYVFFQNHLGYGIF